MTNRLRDGDGRGVPSVGRGGMTGLDGRSRRMFRLDRRVENRARVRIALAAELVELVHVLPEQAAFGSGATFRSMVETMSFLSF
jgi:hypothetical protein